MFEIVDIVRVVAGLAGLFIGGEWLVRGASRIAEHFGISPLIIGLTIVAIGTSAPELLVSIIAAVGGGSDLALGNVVGSNIANIGLILGLTGLITPVAIQATLVRREIPLTILITIFAVLLMLDGAVQRLDGLLLMVGFIATSGFFYWLAVQQHEEDEAAHAGDPPSADEKNVQLGLEFVRIIAGIGALVLGANLLVEGASNFARVLGVPELIIGVTMVALGTSLPELATSIMAAIRKENDIAIGNVIGSNIANLLLVLGATAFIQPFDIQPDLQTVSVELVVMLAFSLLLWPFARNRILSRRESALFLGGYLAFVVYSFIS